MSGMKTPRREETNEALQEELTAITLDIERDMEKHKEEQGILGVTQIEVALGVLFSCAACQSVILRLLQQHQNIAISHGLQMSGKSRGPVSTRVHVNFNQWSPFSDNDLSGAFQSVQAKSSSASSANALNVADDDTFERIPDGTLNSHARFKNVNALRSYVTLLHGELDNNETEKNVLQNTISEFVAKQTATDVLHKTALQSAAAKRGVATKQADKAALRQQRAEDELAVQEAIVIKMKKKLSAITMSSTKQRKRGDRLEGAVAAMDTDNTNDHYRLDTALLSSFGRRIAGLVSAFVPHLRYEEVRKLLYSLVPVVIPGPKELKSENLHKKDINDVLALNGENVFTRRCWTKAEELEKKYYANGGTYQLEDVKAAMSHVLRELRSDATSEAHKKVAAAFWLASCVMSPDKRDVLELDDQLYNVHYKYESTDAIHRKFLELMGPKWMSISVFRDLRPFNVLKGKNNTCLCKLCEEMLLALRAARLHRKLLEIPYCALAVLRRFERVDIHSFGLHT